MANIIARWHQSIEEISESHWQMLLGEKAIPFYEWKWLAALENSRSVSPQQGWQPIHLSLWKGNEPIALAPLYLKGHSYGEFVFDQSFARLATELGLNYYPKILGMSPLSPIEGYQFFISTKENSAEITSLIISIIDNFAIKNKILSCNFLYTDPLWSPLAEACNCARWLNQQSLWFAENHKSFSDYLSSFNANQRRNIKRERKAVKDAGVLVSPVTGPEIDNEMLQQMHTFYENHCARWGPWGSKYLSKSFFDELSSPSQRDQLVLFIAHRGNLRCPIAMSLCIRNGQKLWGRYWGCNEEVNCLHFEVCYYSPIAWALENHIESFDPGAGGSHKRRRGFLAKPHTSLHRWYDKRIDKLIRAWLPKVNKLMMEEIKASNADLPFNVESPPLSSMN